ncbi:hypothetical protein PFISCL1PPCAC_16783, partial [Pristionchus fissidentatus]
SVSLEMLPFHALSRILSHLSFLDRLNLRESSRILEDSIARCDLHVDGRVEISEVPGPLRMKLGTAKPLVYSGANVPNPRRLCSKIDAKEIYLTINCGSSEVQKFYEEIAAKSNFDLLRLGIYRDSERLWNFVRTYSHKKMLIAFQSHDGMNFEALRAIQLPATINFTAGTRLSGDLLKSLLKNGHSLDLVGSVEMSTELMMEILDIIIVSSTIDQFITLDAPVAVSDDFLARMEDFSRKGVMEWRENGVDENDRMFRHRLWLCGRIGVKETRNRGIHGIPVINTRWTFTNKPDN